MAPRRGLASIALVATVLGLAACGRSDVGASAPVPPSSLSSEQQVGVVKDGIRTMLTEMAPAKLGELCAAWRKDPEAVLETFVRPLTATGADPAVAGIAFVQEMTVACR